ncbi:MAG TPA: hypothetical protein VN428_17685 [Bryobacteraceae bacterium]|nr:hypothetical protein [Bryobacteraceae bacterium]
MRTTLQTRAAATARAFFARLSQWFRPALIVNWIPEPDMRSRSERAIDALLDCLERM